MTDEVHIGVDLARSGGDETVVSALLGMKVILLPENAGEVMFMLSTDRSTYVRCANGAYHLKDAEFVRLTH